MAEPSDVSMTAGQPTVLFVGLPAAECAELLEGIAGLRSCAIADLAQAVGWLKHPENGAALIVVGQQWPGQIAAAQISQLRELAPLARVCGYLNSWCEGEPRSGHPWPAALRVYAHQARARLSRKLAELAVGGIGGFALPVTASEEERLLAGTTLAAAQPALVAIVAANAETLSALEDTCRGAGYSTLALRASGQVRALDAAVVLWDTLGSQAADVRRVREMRTWFPHAAIVALLGFPRADEIAAARAAGIAAVVSKPFRVADLLWQIAQLLPEQPSYAAASQPSFRSVRKISRFQSDS